MSQLSWQFHLNKKMNADCKFSVGEWRVADNGAKKIHSYKNVCFYKLWKIFLNLLVQGKFGDQNFWGVSSPENLISGFSVCSVFPCHHRFLQHRLQDIGFRFLGYHRFLRHKPRHWILLSNHHRFWGHRFRRLNLGFF